MQSLMPSWPLSKLAKKFIIAFVPSIFRKDDAVDDPMRENETNTTTVRSFIMPNRVTR